MVPEPHRFMADVDAPLVQQVLDISERKQEPNLHHHRRADDLGARPRVAKWGAFCHVARPARPPA
jgi:hypothetical protein